MGKILLVNGSPNEHGCTATALGEIADTLQKNGVEVEFYSSGKIKNYCVWNKSRLVGKFYEWYENGKIKKYVDRDQNKRFEFDEQGIITKQGKAD